MASSHLIISSYHHLISFIAWRESIMSWRHHCIAEQDIELGLGYLQTTELALTLLTCMLTFGTGRTNYLQGVVHLVLFVSYVFLIFD